MPFRSISDMLVASLQCLLALMRVMLMQGVKDDSPFVGGSQTFNFNRAKPWDKPKRDPFTVSDLRKSTYVEMLFCFPHLV